jgi:hypothetical protein
MARLHRVRPPRVPLGFGEVAVPSSTPVLTTSSPITRVFSGEQGDYELSVFSSESRWWAPETSTTLRNVLLFVGNVLIVKSGYRNV